MLPPDQIPAAIQQSFARTDRALLSTRRPWASLEEMAAYRGRNNPRLPPEWVLHLVRHGAREVEGGWVWKADPMFGVGIPSEFNVAMLEVEMRHVRCPVLVLTGDQEDTWREHDHEELEARVSWLRARHEVVTGTGPLRPHRGPRHDDGPHRGVRGRGRSVTRVVAPARPRRRGRGGAVARRLHRSSGTSQTSPATG